MIAVALAVFYLSAQSTVSAQTEPKSTLERFAGQWTAPRSEVRLNTDFDVSVWGANATSVRRVQLTLSPKGEGTIKVTRSVVDGHGRTIKASVSVEQADLQLRLPDGIDPARIEPIVEVCNPQRTYPDSPKDNWPLTGLAVKIFATDLEHERLNLRFDLPDGNGSFGETLVRAGSHAAPKVPRKS
jgi:hypothetical protein